MIYKLLMFVFVLTSFVLSIPPEAFVKNNGKFVEIFMIVDAHWNGKNHIDTTRVLILKSAIIGVDLFKLEVSQHPVNL